MSGAGDGVVISEVEEEDLAVGHADGDPLVSCDEEESAVIPVMQLGPEDTLVTLCVVSDKPIRGRWAKKLPFACWVTEGRMKYPIGVPY
jgi:hypothetical protein